MTPPINIYKKKIYIYIVTKPKDGKQKPLTVDFPAATAFSVGQNNGLYAASKSS